MKIQVDTSQLRFDERTEKIRVMTNQGTRKISERYRDRLKENFISASAGSSYEAKASISVGSSKSITHALVVSDSQLPSMYTVGPKLGGMNTSGGENPNYKSYETILGYNEKGTINGKQWKFKLLPNRAGAASDSGGYWTTRGIKPKKFFEKTYREYSSGKLDIDTKFIMKPLVDRGLDE